MDLEQSRGQSLVGPHRRVRRCVVQGVALLIIAVGTTMPNGVRWIENSASYTELQGATAISAQSPSPDEAEFARLLNESRSANGKPALSVNLSLAQTSRTWSGSMRTANSISHDPNLGKIMTEVVPGWTRAAENVGVGYSVEGLHQAFWNSAGHRANMLGDFNQVGVGVARSADGRIWVTFRFAKGPLPPPAHATSDSDRIGVHRSNSLYLRRDLAPGVADVKFAYGTTEDQAVMGDWNGDGVATPGVFRAGSWYLRNSNTVGAADVVFNFGMSGDAPVVGDWDGNGTDTIGIRRGTLFLLRNDNSSGGANYAFEYGRAADLPLAGDWDGNGTETIGVHRGATFLLRNTNTGGGANRSFTYGRVGDEPLAGDWDGNGTTTIGVRRGNIFYLRNTNSSGTANVGFGYGTAGDAVVVGGGW